MIHVLLEESLYDEDFVRDWTNAAFLVREDTGQLLTGQDLAPPADPHRFFVWDRQRGGPAASRADGGYGQDRVEPALSGPCRVTRADGETVSCRPALDLLGELAARYAPERSEAITWVPAGEVRRAARLAARRARGRRPPVPGLRRYRHRHAWITDPGVAPLTAITAQALSPGATGRGHAAPSQRRH